MDKFNAGTAVLIEVQFKESIPFADDEFYDPTSTTLTVYDRNDVVRVDSASLSRSGTGKYYYPIQTEASWPKGMYRVLIQAVSGIYNSKKIINQAFLLE